MLLTYILIILTALIGILSNLVEITEEHNELHFRKIDKFRILILVLLLVLLVIGLLNQRKDDDLKKLEAETTRQKEANDSMIASRRFENLDRSHQETINNFLIQRGVDSILLSKDSLNFLFTLQKFKEQLITQNNTFKEVRNVLNPLFPMIIKTRFVIKVDSLDKGIKDEFNLNINKMPSSNDDTIANRFPRGYACDRNDTAVFSVSFDVNRSELDSLEEYTTREFSQLTSYLKYFNPEYYTITFFSPEKDKKINLKIDLLKGNFHFFYDRSENEINIFWDTNIDPTRVERDNISSIQQCLRDSLLIAVNPGLMADKISIEQVILLLGESYFNGYSISPELEMKRRRYYTEGVRKHELFTEYRARINK